MKWKDEDRDHSERSDRFVVDSTGWVEFLGDGPKAGAFSKYFENTQSLLLPTIVVYEVYKKILRGQGQALADRFLSHAFAFQNREVPWISLLPFRRPKGACKRICSWRMPSSMLLLRLIKPS